MDSLPPYTRPDAHLVVPLGAQPESFESAVRAAGGVVEVGANARAGLGQHEWTVRKLVDVPKGDQVRIVYGRSRLVSEVHAPHITGIAGNRAKLSQRLAIPLGLSDERLVFAQLRFSDFGVPYACQDRGYTLNLRCNDVVTLLNVLGRLEAQDARGAYDPGGFYLLAHLPEACPRHGFGSRPLPAAVFGVDLNKNKYYQRGVGGARFQHRIGLVNFLTRWFASSPMVVALTVWRSTTSRHIR